MLIEMYEIEEICNRMQFDGKKNLLTSRITNEIATVTTLFFHEKYGFDQSNGCLDVVSYLL